jgi:protease-4
MVNGRNLTKWSSAAMLTAAVMFAAAPLSLRAADAATAPAAAAGEPTQIVLLHLSNTLSEKPTSFKLSLLNMAPEKSPALSQVMLTLEKLRDDKTVGGVFLDLQSFSLGLAQAEDLGVVLQAIRHSGKRVVLFAQDFDTATYVLASNADTIIMPENGNMMVPGVRLELMFYKGLFDKLDVFADFVQIGKFKGAEEPFTRTDASPEFSEQVTGLVDGFYGQMISEIANHRQLSEKETEAAVADGWITGKHAKEIGLVDHLMARPEVDHWLSTQFPDGAEIVKDYDQPHQQKVNFDNPFALFQLIGQPKESTRTSAPAVAVIVASGEIIDDTASGETDDEHITPASIRDSLKTVMKDPLVKRIVLRVDSPGGSATASDDIWQMLKEADKTEPVTVSMGRMAASGGYYISCAGRTITADPCTITGSIGVVGGKFVLRGLFDKVGLSVEPFEHGKHAGLFSAVSPFTAEEKEYVQGLMTDTYKIFTGRVMTSRGDKVKKIEDVAQGRLFDGPAAKAAGLVDNVGSLSDTIAAAAMDAKIADHYQVLVYPEAKTFADILRQSFGIDSKVPLDAQVALSALPAEYREQAMNLLDLMPTLAREKVLLTAPPIVER